MREPIYIESNPQSVGYWRSSYLNPGGALKNDMITYKQYRKAWDHAGQGNTPDVPIHIDLEFSSICNLKCPMCPQTILPKDQKQFIDIKLAKRIIDEAHDIGVMSVKLNWRGEATLHPQFTEIAEYCKGKFVDVMLNTNGMYDPRLREIIRDCFDTVVFSVDSLNQKTLNKIRPNSDIKIILDNVDYLLCYSETRPYIRINHTRQKENWNELATFEHFWFEQFLEKDSTIDLNVRPMFPRTDYDVEFIKDKRKITGRKNCGYPFQRLVIGYDGSVYPCCVAWDGELKVGNFNKNQFSLVSDRSLMDIWDSLPMDIVRRAQTTDDVMIPSTCQNCTSWNSYTYEEM